MIFYEQARLTNWFLFGFNPHANIYVTNVTRIKRKVICLMAREKVVVKHVAMQPWKLKH